MIAQLVVRGPASEGGSRATEGVTQLAEVIIGFCGIDTDDTGTVCATEALQGLDTLHRHGQIVLSALIQAGLCSPRVELIRRLAAPADDAVVAPKV